MALKLKNLGAVFKDAKTRTILIVVAVIIIIGILIGWLGLMRSEQKGVPAAAKVQRVPRDITSIPGVGTASREYAKLQEQENVQKAQQALKQGTSAVPTIIRTTYTGPSEFAPPAVATADSEMVNPECSPEALARARQAGVKAEELRCKDCSAAELRAAGYTAGELMNAGFSANQLRAAGFSANELRAAGFTAAELSRAGVSPSELLAAGFNAAELSQAGVGSDQLKAAGLTAAQIAAAGIGVKPANLPKDCSVQALSQARAQGISAGALRQMGCGAAALRAAGFSAQELKDAGFNAKELKGAGYSAEDLKNAGFTAGELRQAGFGANSLKAAGFGADELRNAGFSAGELAAAGYTNDELSAAGYSDGELVRAGLAPTTAVTPGAGQTPQQPAAATVTTAPTTVAALPPIESKDASIAALEQLQRRQAEQLSMQDRQDRITQMQQAMTQQAQDLFAAWSPPPGQQYTAGTEEKSQQNVGAAGTTMQGGQISTSQMAAQIPIIKAGDIMFAVLETSLNSDEPSPILATIVSGPYQGAKLVGNFQRIDKRVILSFTSMNIPSAGFPQSVGINAVAVDPNTARTALASHVDSHYLLRYGTLFASAFASGLGDAISQSDSTTNITISGISTSTAKKSVAEEGLMALGEVGKQFGNVMASNFHRAPTVTVKSGEGIGILFMGDVQGLPAVPPPVAATTPSPASSTGPAAQTVQTTTTTLQPTTASR